MKYTFNKLIVSFFLLMTSAILFLACKKEEDQMIPPKLEFKTGAGYTSADASVAQNAVVTIGVTAEQTEEEDFLKTFTVSHSFDGAAEVTDSTVILEESEHEEFEEDIHITTRSQTGTEKYIFTITNRDGLITSKSITLTVK
jgi:hypothetical protein